LYIFFHQDEISDDPCTWDILKSIETMRKMKYCDLNPTTPSANQYLSEEPCMHVWPSSKNDFFL
jgi:hypothetical protein